MKDSKYANARISALRTRAVNSRSIGWIDKLTRQSVMLYGRESEASQKDHLPHQIAFVKAEFERRGFKVVATFGEIEPGRERTKDVELNKGARMAFEQAVREAKRAGLLLVAEAVNRFWRPFDYHHTENKDAWMSEFDMRALLEATEGVRLATLYHPDLPESAVRSLQTRRGQASRRAYGGRPKEAKKQRRSRLRQKVIALRAQGMSWGEIENQTGIARSTARNWYQNRTPAGPNLNGV